MKIAILGCGYVGQAAAKRWQQQGHFITVTTRSPEKAESLAKSYDAVHLLNGHDMAEMATLLQDQDAILMAVAADNQAAYEMTYLETAKTLANVMLKAPKLKHILYTGSTSVYGDYQGRLVTEDDPLKPTHETSQILIRTEVELLALNTPSRHVCIFRLGEIYGPGREIEDRLRRLNGKSLPGTGESITNLIHLNDIVNALDLALKKPLDGIYNLCNDLHISRKDLYTKLCATFDLPTVTWDQTRVNIHSGNKIVSNAKIKAAGFHFLH